MIKKVALAMILVGSIATVTAASNENEKPAPTKTTTAAPMAVVPMAIVPVATTPLPACKARAAAASSDAARPNFTPARAATLVAHGPLLPPDPWDMGGGSSGCCLTYCCSWYDVICILTCNCMGPCQI